MTEPGAVLEAAHTAISDLASQCFPRSTCRCCCFTATAMCGRAAPRSSGSAHQHAGSTLLQLPGVGHCGHLQTPKPWNRAVLE